YATKMLQFKPGRDVAMLNALLHTIVEEELHDRQYVQAHTEDFEKLREHIKDYPPEKMAELCGIDAETLRVVARDYARSRASIICWGLWQTSLDPKRGLTVVEIMDAVHAGQIKGMYIMGENPAMSDPDVQHAREALAKLDHLVVQDIFLTETAKYADVVLPASAWPEKDGTVTNTNRQVQIGRTALPMPGDARQDWWITQEIARRIGLDWQYTHPRDVFAEMKQAMPSLNGISWERLQRESSVTYPCDAE